MLLRARIFRQLVTFALIPAIIIALVSYLLLIRAINQTEQWLASGSPERTINTLRLAESRLQEQAESILRSSNLNNTKIEVSGLDWLITTDSEYYVEPYKSQRLIDTLRQAVSNSYNAGGPIRLVAENYLIIGAAIETDNQLVAGGYLFGREYLSGYATATTYLSEARGFKNILPAYLTFISLSGGVILVIVIVIAYFLSRRLSAAITHPLEQLAAFADGIANQNRLRKIYVSGTDEIVTLADTLNRMIDALDESRRKLLAAERVAAWQEFARRMAHELKNPLTPISVSLYRIKKRLESSGDYDQYAEAIEAITAEVAHLERLANDYSTLARLPEPKFKQLDFIALVEEIISLFSGQLEKYDFIKQVNFGRILIEGDYDRLREVMVNLFKNAVVFTPEGGRIVTLVDQEPDCTVFAVKNDNISHGLDDEQLKSAKTPYFTTREDGTGLGLAISEKIIVDHGGTLTLKTDDGMTVACFKLPIRQIDRH